MAGFSALALLGIAWSVVTVALVVLIIYRAVMGIHEENQIFLDRAEAAMEKEQVATLRRINTLDTFIKGLAILSSALLVIMAAIWVYGGFHGQAP